LKDEVTTELAAVEIANAETVWLKESQRELTKHKGFPTLEVAAWPCP